MISAVAPWLLFFILFVFSFPIIIMLNLALVSILASNYLVQFIARREYPDLIVRGRPRFARGFKNTLVSSALFLIFWIATVPLWLVPGVALVLPVMLTAWFNRRVCAFDALTEFTTDDELNALLQMNSGQGFVLGLFTALLNYVPMAFLISPVLTMVAFIHLNLTSLQSARSGLGDGESVAILTTSSIQ